MPPSEASDSIAAVVRLLTGKGRVFWKMAFTSIVFQTVTGFMGIGTDHSPCLRFAPFDHKESDSLWLEIFPI
jgi:hypothetical protein